MSGECDKCGEHTLECTCTTLQGFGPFGEMLPVKWASVRGREAHERLIKDAAKCKELGLDQIYEVNAYLTRWGGWLRD